MAEQVDYVVVGLGALGSATAYELAKRGCSVVGLERFALGHDRGASHDTSRILRHSYHTPGYVELSFDAYRDWAALETDSGEQLVTEVGGLDLFPPRAAIPMDDYVDSMTALGVDFSVLDRDAVVRRWPQFSLPGGTIALFQERASIVPAGRGTSVLQAMARRHGATLRDRSAVSGLTDLGSRGVEVRAGDAVYSCRRAVVCADAWTNEVITGLDWRVPLTVTLEQVTYFRPQQPQRFMPGRLPLWIWMDDPSFYGFPCYGEQTVKAAQDCGGQEVSGDDRAFEPDAQRLSVLAEFMSRTLPGTGAPVRSKTCLYTLTPDRDFVVGPIPGHEAVLVGMGAAHGFKFAPTIGRLLADLAVDGRTDADVTPFRLDRAALTEPSQPVSWLV
jgi:monomeric sarcosine oxidase